MPNEQWTIKICWYPCGAVWKVPSILHVSDTAATRYNCEEEKPIKRLGSSGPLSYFKKDSSVFKVHNVTGICVWAKFMSSKFKFLTYRIRRSIEFSAIAFVNVGVLVVSVRRSWVFTKLDLLLSTWLTNLLSVFL